MVGEETLFQASARRLTGKGFRPPVVITGAAFRFTVAEQLLAIGIDPETIMIEPEGRNTAPAVLAAALHLFDKDPAAIMLVTPSDHVMPDRDAFQAAVWRGVDAVQKGQVVTFGLVPNAPHTGYGYLELTTCPDGSGAAVALKGFVEKPALQRAQEMVASGNFLWNSGIFLARARDMIDLFKAHAPQMCAPVGQAVAQAAPDLGFLRLAPEPWAKVEDISVDFAVMEHADNLAAVPYTERWSDLGGWDSVWSESTPDKNGVVASGGATAIECTNSLLRSETEGLEIVGVGLNNIVAVAMSDAVLVADMNRAQDVRRVVKALKAKNAPQAVQFPMDHRPWGWFESLVVGDRFQVKRIHVKAGASLSLQSHFHRAEHWIVVEGTAKVTVGDAVKLVSENESIYVPLGSKHRLENPGKVPMVLIEVQTGAYLGEDDIVRHEDVYARCPGE
ncbi:mannose-1-phosphate guanyltransferase [Actibacterium mucosum KCTC 23349]|uniref:mannose-1-phosphate guanylyltransferase n=1 Tax=Actibacterium mucosum KCTC 23349 TaxID=1454373 RepID=A0A037ZRB2_9RHOB|nr:mannose-1-phosphate guanyltransferase [Actibacterium mucosum KCTC 23349]